MGIKIPWAALVVPTYGEAGVGLVAQCLSSFHAHHPNTESEIFVVSDGDTGDVLDQLEAVCQAQQAELVVQERGGFAHACNAGLRRSNAEVTFLVNNDVEFIAPSLLILFDASRVFQAGLVGCRLLYPDRTIQHAGVAYVPRKDAPGYFDHRLRNQPESHPYALRTYPSLVTGALLGVTRWFIDTVGLLDERFGFAVEDIDAGLMCHEAGRNSMYCGYTAAIHHEGKTRGRTLEEKLARFPDLVEKENAALAALQAKWVGLDWSNFQ